MRAIQILGSTLFQTVSTVIKKAHFWGPDRWHCSIQGTWYAPNLQDEIGQADTMGDSDQVPSVKVLVEEPNEVSILETLWSLMQTLLGIAYPQQRMENQL